MDEHKVPINPYLNPQGSLFFLNEKLVTSHHYFLHQFLLTQRCVSGFSQHPKPKLRQSFLDQWSGFLQGCCLKFGWNGIWFEDLTSVYLIATSSTSVKTVGLSATSIELRLKGVLYVKYASTMASLSILPAKP